ncbi:unnamed protein product, partial [Allacma fusca]
TLYLTP